MHMAMPTLVLAVDQYFWMMYNVAQVLVSCLNVPVGQLRLITAVTLLMLV